MSKQENAKGWVRIAGFVSPEADELIRGKARRKGDLSRLLDVAIKQTYKPKETQTPELPAGTMTT